MSVKIVSQKGKRKQVYIEKTQNANHFDAKHLVKGARTFLLIDPQRSKLGAGVLCGLDHLPGETDAVLYLGASAGYTVSFLAHLVPLIFAVEVSPVMARDLVFLSEKYTTIAPIFADANHPKTYAPRICLADYLFQDISQKNQVDIFLKNMLLLKKGGIAVLSLKARNIDFSKKPSDIFNNVLAVLESTPSTKILQSFPLERYQKDHFMIVVQHV
jgi:fibrillarin-like pre-rRNA processing protein